MSPGPACFLGSAPEEIHDRICVRAGKGQLAAHWQKGRRPGKRDSCSGYLQGYCSNWRDAQARSRMISSPLLCSPCTTLYRVWGTHPEGVRRGVQVHICFPDGLQGQLFPFGGVSEHPGWLLDLPCESLQGRSKHGRVLGEPQHSACHRKILRARLAIGLHDFYPHGVVRNLLVGSPPSNCKRGWES